MDVITWIQGLDSVGDVFGRSLFFAAGLIVLKSGVLPRWLGRVSIVVGIMFFLQGFGLGGVIASFGLVLDLIGFVLFLIFVLVSSVILLRRETAAANTAAAIEWIHFGGVAGRRRRVQHDALSGWQARGLGDTAVIRCHGELMRHWRNSFSARATATGSPLDRAEGRLR